MTMKAERAMRTAEPPSDEALVTPLVVVVEEQPEIRNLLSEYLLSRGAVPVPAPSAAHAEVVCRTLSPGLVLIDLPAPDIDGLALVRRLRARWPRVPIAVCLAPDPRREARYRAEGADEIVAKPIDLVHVDRVLREVAAPTARAP
jgi:DNA-binding response OmpR family regulator